MDSPSAYQIRGDIPAVSPAAFLGLGEGEPRGFWASGDRWVAHAGVLRKVAVREDTACREGTPAEADRSGEGVDRVRFRSVQIEASRVFEGIEPGGAHTRIFGGFAFASRPSTDRVWSPFPPALFHLPEAEVEHDPSAGACSLVVHARSRQDAERSWERWADALKRSLSTVPVGPARAGRPDGSAAERVAGIDRAAWSRMIWRTLQRIRAGDAEKVVLARALDVTPPRQVAPLDVALALWEESHGSHVFLFEPVGGRAVVGAAPETIAAMVNGVVRATAVAGSVGVGVDSVETAQLARNLFESEKDRAEHDFVVQDMVARLSALGCAVQRDIEPHVLALARIQHLETKIAAKVPDGVTLLEILASLHPTPAVCGIPRNVALSILTESEEFDRGWYAGPVGWLASDGKGIFVPALRSAVCDGSRWRLFAGAGIVPGSDPALEWTETELKFDPVLRAVARAEMAGSAAAGLG